MDTYPGPTREGPLPVLLHNTIYAVKGEVVDGVADARGLRSWLEAIGDQLPSPVRAVDGARLEELHALRGAVREALHAVLERRPIAAGALAELNQRSAGAPHFDQLSNDGLGPLAETRYDAATPTDLLLGHLAAATIDLVSGPDASLLRACGAPGCVLLFLKDHPRREWCSTRCGNRARQARHYRLHAGKSA